MKLFFFFLLTLKVVLSLLFIPTVTVALPRQDDLNISLGVNEAFKK